MRTYINTTRSALALALSNGYTVWCNGTGEGFNMDAEHMNYNDAYYAAQFILEDRKDYMFYYYEEA